MTLKDWHDTTAWKKARAYAKTQLEPICVACNKDLAGEDWTIDHIVPPNGDAPNHDLGNLQSMCRKCNSQKQDRQLHRIAWRSTRW